MSNAIDKKQEYREKIQAQFDRLNQQIEELKLKGLEFKDNAQVEYEKKLAELYSKRENAQLKLQELQNSSDEAWIEMQKGFEKAWNELNHAYDRALGKF